MTHLPDTLRDLFGDELLDGLVAEGRWDVLEAMWRSGSADIAGRAGRAMAGSGVPEVVDRVALAFVDQAPGQPVGEELQSVLGDAACTPGIADHLLEQVSAEERAIPSPHVLWLMAQPGEAIVDFAVSTVGRADVPVDLRTAAADRCSADRSAQVRAVEALSGLDRSGVGQWTTAADLLTRVIGSGQVRGATELVRTMIDEVLELPTPTIPPAFVGKLASKPTLLVEALEGAQPLPGDQLLGGYALIASVMDALEEPHAQVDLALCVAEHHPEVWRHFHNPVSASWTEPTWEEFFARSPSADPQGFDLCVGSMLAASANLDLDVVCVVAAAAHASLDDPASQAVSEAATRVRDRLDGSDADLEVLEQLQTPGDDAAAWEPFLEVLRQAVPDETRRASVAGSLIGREALPANRGLGLVEAGRIADAYSEILDDELAARFVRAALEGAADSPAEFAAIVEDEFDSVVVTELARVGHTSEAFATIIDCWNDLGSDDQDLVVALLEDHATVGDADVLDHIAGETAGVNRDRRARATRRWADLVPTGSAFSSGIASLLEAATPELAQAIAEVAAKVRPTSPETLRALRDRWAGDAANPQSAPFRTALDAIDSDLAAQLAAVPDHELPQKAPELCDALAITAGPDGFDALIALVGQDARNDAAPVRRTAAAAIKEYFTAHPVTATSEMLSKLGTVAGQKTGELDHEAREDLGVALRRAELGEDAVLATLDHALGADHRLGDLLGGEKAKVLRALNQVVVRRSEGAAGESSLVQELDNAAHHIGRATYLAVGKSDNLRQKIADDPGDMNQVVKWGNVLEALPSSGVAVNHLQTLHDIRSKKTSSHGGTLDPGDAAYAETEFAEGIRVLYGRLVEADEAGPSLRAVPDD